MAAKWLGRIGSAESPTIAMRRFSFRMRNRSQAPLDARTVASGREGRSLRSRERMGTLIRDSLLHHDHEERRMPLLLPPFPRLSEATLLSPLRPSPVAVLGRDPSRC